MNTYRASPFWVPQAPFSMQRPAQGWENEADREVVGRAGSHSFLRVVVNMANPPSGFLTIAPYLFHLSVWNMLFYPDNFSTGCDICQTCLLQDHKFALTLSKNIKSHILLTESGEGGRRVKVTSPHAPCPAVIRPCSHQSLAPSLLAFSVSEETVLASDFPFSNPACFVNHSSSDLPYGLLSKL